MDENLYIGEDHDFFYRLNKKIINLKILFDKNVFVYHEDRELKFFLMQRFCYGLNIFTSNNTGIKRFFATLPFLTIIFFTTILTIDTKLFIQTSIISFFFLSFLIFLEINSYVKKIKDKVIVIFSIIISNLFYGFGTIFYLFGIRKLIEKKIYRSIKSSKFINKKN